MKTIVVKYQKMEKSKQSLILFAIGYLFLIPLILAFFPDGILTNGLQQFLLIVLSVVIIRKLGAAFKDMYIRIEQLNRYSYVVAIASVVILMVGILMSFMKAQLPNTMNDNQIMVIQSFEQSGMLSIITLVIFSPVLEELIFKYVLFDQTRFLNKNKMLKMTFLSLLFVLLHTSVNVTSMNLALGLDAIYYFLFSIVTMILYYKTDNILFPIAVHVLCNIVALVI